MKKTLSVIIPNYNKAKYISDTICSILNQTRIPDEIIIVDDCSTDSSREVIIDFYKKNRNLIKYVFLDENKGVQHCRNIGAQNSKSDYICFVDSDDVFLRTDCIERQLDAATDKTMVGVYQLTIDNNNRMTSKPLSNREKRKYKRWYLYYMYLLNNFMFWPMHYIFYKQIFFDVGMFNSAYNLYEDAELIFKLFEYGIKPIWINIEGKGYRISFNDKDHLSNASSEKHTLARVLFHKNHWNKLPVLTKIRCVLSRNWKNIKYEIK